MKPKQSIAFSLAMIGALLLMMVAPAETESTTAGWVAYGIFIGLLLSVTFRAFSVLMYEHKYKHSRKVHRSRHR